MLKKWIERIFRRQELEALAQEVGEKEEEIRLLTTGDSMKLDQHERRMILDAIEYIPFREAIELPETKAWIRIIWRDIRKKIQMSIKKGGD
jgi:hypothetical protein